MDSVHGAKYTVMSSISRSTHSDKCTQFLECSASRCDQEATTDLL